MDLKVQTVKREVSEQEQEIIRQIAWTFRLWGDIERRIIGRKSTPEMLARQADLVRQFHELSAELVALG